MAELWDHIILLCTLISIFFLDKQIIYGGGANYWSYDGVLNPYRWPLVYPLCAGRAQSPVAIDTSDVDYDSSLGRFSFNGYETVRNVQTSLQNNGHTVEVDLTGRPIAIRGGGLEGIYRVKQFHFHWGATDRRGSEHEINGYHYPMEMHIVHYATRFGNYEAAQSQPDGLAVLAFFFQVGQHNQNFDVIINHLDEIRFRGDTVPLESFPLASLLPRNMRDFYRYRGSLTTPPCYESVVWTIFKSPEEISEMQLNRFRFLVNENFPNQTNDKISDDYRPVQALNGRRILSSDASDRRRPPRRIIPSVNPQISGAISNIPQRRRTNPRSSILNNQGNALRLRTFNDIDRLTRSRFRGGLVPLPRRSLTLPRTLQRVPWQFSGFPQGSVFDARTGLTLPRRGFPPQRQFQPFSPFLPFPRQLSSRAAFLMERRRRLRNIARRRQNPLFFF